MTIKGEFWYLSKTGIPEDSFILLIEKMDGQALQEMVTGVLPKYLKKRHNRVV